MADNDNESAAARLAFDREKWTVEAALREREIALKEREQKFSSWTNPLTVAVAVAAVAWVGNVVLTGWNGRLQRVLEQEKASQQQRLEETKAESERILEVIKTGDPTKAATNLKFLLEAGLIASEERVKRLSDYLAQTAPGSGPALPVSGAGFKFEQTEALTKPVAARLEADLRAFAAYLDRIGIPKDTGGVRIRVDELSVPNAEYHPDQNMMVIDKRIVDDPYPARREYMHHLLFASKKDYQWTSAIADIENGLADYLSGSFAGDPVLGEARTAAVLGVDRGYIRRLDNDRTYTHRRPGDPPHEYGEMWGGTFWDIRSKLGQDSTDRALALAWQSMPWPIAEQETVSGFVTALLAAVEKTAGPARTAEAVAALGHRKIPVPR